MNSRLATANTNYMFDKKYSSTLLGNLKTDDSQKENTTIGSSTAHGNHMKIQRQTAMVTRKISQLENKPSASKEKRTPTGKSLLNTCTRQYYILHDETLRTVGV